MKTFLMSIAAGAMALTGVAAAAQAQPWDGYRGQGYERGHRDRDWRDDRGYGRGDVQRSRATYRTAEYNDGPPIVSRNGDRTCRTEFHGYRAVRTCWTR